MSPTRRYWVTMVAKSTLSLTYILDNRMSLSSTSSETFFFTLFDVFTLFSLLFSSHKKGCFNQRESFFHDLCSRRHYASFYFYLHFYSFLFLGTSEGEILCFEMPSHGSDIKLVQSLQGENGTIEQLNIVTRCPKAVCGHRYPCPNFVKFLLILWSDWGSGPEGGDVLLLDCLGMEVLEAWLGAPVARMVAL